VLVHEHRPRIVAIAGVTAYRTAFGHRHATVGPQPDRLADAQAWVVPNPSGLNAHWSLDAIAAQFAALRADADQPPPTQ
jgi:TDG/mug DNA glycosylase family protein